MLLIQENRKPFFMTWTEISKSKISMTNVAIEYGMYTALYLCHPAVPIQLIPKIRPNRDTVSYTHLTLPTTSRV